MQAIAAQRGRAETLATRPPYPGRIHPRWGVTNRVPRRAGALRARTQESPLRCAHARDERPRAGVGAARDGRRGIRRIRRRHRRTGRCGARAVVESVRRRRLAPDRPRPAVGEGCRDRAVRHGRQGRAAHRHRDRARGGVRGGGRARGTASALGTRAGGAHRRGRRGGGDRPAPTRSMLAFAPSAIAAIAAILALQFLVRRLPVADAAPAPAAAIRCRMPRPCRRRRAPAHPAPSRPRPDARPTGRRPPPLPHAGRAARP